MSALTVYSKSSSKRRQAYSNPKKRSKGTAAITRAVKSVMLRTMETKSSDYFIDSEALIVPVSYCLNGVPTGAGVYQGVGSKIKMQSLALRLAVTSAGGGTTGSQLFRWMLVVDKQSNGSSAPLGALLRTVTVTDPALAPRESDMYDRFTVLHDECVCIGHSTQNAQYVVDKTFDLSRIGNVQYSGNSGTFTDVSSNALYLWIIPSNQAFFSFDVADPEITFGSQLRFKDI